MLENAAQEAPAADVTPVARGPSSAIAALASELAGHRVRPRLVASRQGFTAGGVSLRVALNSLLQSDAAGESLMRRVAGLLADRVPVCLSLSDLGPGDQSLDVLERFCLALRKALSVEDLDPACLGLSLHSHVVPMPAFLLITAALLGEGPRYVIFDALQMRLQSRGQLSDEAMAEVRGNWSFLWRRQGATPVLTPSYASGVATRCPLLCDEAAATVLPVGGLQAPAATAWLPMQVHLPDFCGAGGSLDWEALQRALEAAIHIGDRLLELLRWPLPQQASDALENRRLAIEIDGLGDLALARWADPENPGCLEWLHGTVARVHALLWQRSRQLARDIGPLPALSVNRPAPHWDCQTKRSDWDLRWRQAVASCGVRHRNLMVLSPYSVLPASTLSPGPSAAAFAKLLPVLDHADAFSFAPPQVPPFRSGREFVSFHRRAWAVMQRRNAASLVAAGV